LLAASLALWFTLRVSWSDWVARDATRDGIRAAIGMMPENWKFYRDWGEFVPAEGVEALSGAVLLNPMNPQLRLELAEVAEKAGKDGLAERSLLEAVARDRTATARTLLAEYYFRKGDAAHFWAAARGALEVAAVGDAELFRECWEMEGLTVTNGDFFQGTIPKRPEILWDYLDFLLNTGRLDAAARVGDEAMRARNGGRKAERAAMKYCGAMAQAGRAREAVMAWNWLASEKAVRGGELGEGARGWVTDGGFEWDPFGGNSEGGVGFGWQRTGAVGTEWAEKARELRVTFSGKQPERCEVLGQEVALWPGREYWARVKYETRGIGAESGLKWRVVLRDGTVLGEVGMPGGEGAFGSAGERSVEMKFRGTFAAPVVGRLALVYERELGTVRIEGEAAIREVASGWR
jgi:tetratricopeptide (TPR) repeat protein